MECSLGLTVEVKRARTNADGAFPWCDLAFCRRIHNEGKLLHEVSDRMAEGRPSTTHADYTRNVILVRRSGCHRV
jgi:hypothetical protein